MWGRAYRGISGEKDTVQNCMIRILQLRPEPSVLSRHSKRSAKLSETPDILSEKVREFAPRHQKQPRDSEQGAIRRANSRHSTAMHLTGLSFRCQWPQEPCVPVHQPPFRVTAGPHPLQQRKHRFAPLLAQIHQPPERTGNGKRHNPRRKQRWHGLLLQCTAGCSLSKL